MFALEALANFEVVPVDRKCNLGSRCSKTTSMDGAVSCPAGTLFRRAQQLFVLRPIPHCPPGLCCSYAVSGPMSGSSQPLEWL